MERGQLKDGRAGSGECGGQGAGGVRRGFGFGTVGRVAGGAANCDQRSRSE